MNFSAIHPHVQIKFEILWHDTNEMPTSLTTDCDAPVFRNKFSHSHHNLVSFSFYIQMHILNIQCHTTDAQLLSFKNQPHVLTPHKVSKPILPSFIAQLNAHMLFFETYHFLLQHNHKQQITYVTCVWHSTQL